MDQMIFYIVANTFESFSSQRLFLPRKRNDKYNIKRNTERYENEQSKDFEKLSTSS